MTLLSRLKTFYPNYQSIEMLEHLKYVSFAAPSSTACQLFKRQLNSDGLTLTPLTMTSMLQQIKYKMVVIPGFCPEKYWPFLDRQKDSMIFTR